MRKALAMILAAVMLAACLASCAVIPTATTGSKIRTTSSDAEDAAAWLAGRLGDKLTEDVVLGTNDGGYEVDLSALAADGYFIRVLGDKVALLARTTEGLDRAVRRYAKAVERGETIADETYREGARVGRLTVAGADISAFAIRVEGPGRDEDVSRLAERIGSVAAPAFAGLVELTCGATLANAESAEHFVIFRPSPDGAFTEGDFRYAVEDGDLVFEYCELLGAKNGVVTFFEDECGWQGLDAGRDFLAPCEHIDVAADTDVSVDTMLDGLLLPSRAAFGTERRNSAYMSCEAYRPLYGTDYRIPHACNGWLSYRWGGYDVSVSTPCMTNDAVLSQVLDSITEYIDSKVAAGAVVGYDLNYIDVAHGDTWLFCPCPKCSKVYGDEGSRSGASVRFANAIAEALEEEGYSPLKVITYAYMGNFAPCKTRPRDDVYVTLCLHARCVTHPVDATCCVNEITHPTEHAGPRLFAKWMKGWGELTDNLYLWDYFLDHNIHPYILVDQIWGDMHYMRECRVTRTYWECHQCGIGPMELQCQLALWLNRHPDATKEEYNDKYRELLELHYGDGWEKMWEAFELWERAELEYAGDCLGWQYTTAIDPTQMNYAYYLNECHDRIISLFDGAIDDAKCAEDVRELELLKAAHLYLCCNGGYFYADEAGDAEYMAALEAKYAEMLAILAKYGVTVSGTLGNEGADFSLAENMLDTARGLWNVKTAYINKYAREVIAEQFEEYDGDGALKLGGK